MVRNDHSIPPLTGIHPPFTELSGTVNGTSLDDVFFNQRLRPVSFGRIISAPTGHEQMEKYPHPLSFAPRAAYITLFRMVPMALFSSRDTCA